MGGLGTIFWVVTKAVFNEQQANQKTPPSSLYWGLRLNQEQKGEACVTGLGALVSILLFYRQWVFGVGMFWLLPTTGYPAGTLHMKVSE